MKAKHQHAFLMPTCCGVVFHYVSAVDGVDWVQVGWVQGEGVEIAPDGVPWPVIPLLSGG